MAKLALLAAAVVALALGPVGAARAEVQQLYQLAFTDAAERYYFDITTSGDGDLTVDTRDCCVPGDSWGVVVREDGGPTAQACGTGSITLFTGAAKIASFGQGDAEVFMCSSVGTFPASVTVRFRYTGAAMAVASLGTNPPLPLKLSLDPKADKDIVDTEHCVTAVVRRGDIEPAQGVTVRFRVMGSVTTTGSRATDADGAATFCYPGPIFPGEDAIHAFADEDGDQVQDAGETFDDATKTWVLPPSTLGCEISLTWGGWIITLTGSKGTMGGNAKAGKDGVVSGSQEYHDHSPLTPRNFHSTQTLVVVCTGSHGQIYGLGTVDGLGPFFYRMDVQDNAEPGVGSDVYGIVIASGYYSGHKTLEGGNIQVRRT